MLMKIVIYSLIPLGYPGGSEKYMTGLAKYFSNKHKIEIISCHQYRMIVSYVYRVLSLWKVKHVNYIKREIGKSRSYNFSLFDLLPFGNKYHWLKKKLLSADVIYAKNEFPDLFILYCLLGKDNFSKKVIVGVHSIIFLPQTQPDLNRKIHDFLYLGRIYKTFLKNAKLIHVPSSAYIKLISNRFKIKSNKIIYIPHPIEWRSKYKDRKNKSFNILWIGRLTDQKGVDRLRDIINKLSIDNYFKLINFIIAGQGPDKIIVEQLVKKYENVQYLGYKKNVTSLYLRADLCLSTSYFEVLPYTMLEAQSFGIPVISFNITGSSDIIKDKKTGYLVKDTEEFCQKIEHLFYIKKNDINKYSTLMKNIFKNTNSYFAKKRIYNKLEESFLYGIYS